MPAARLPRWVNRYPPRGFAPRSAGRYTKPRGSSLLTTGTTSAVPLRGVNFARRSGVNIESRLTPPGVVRRDLENESLAGRSQHHSDLGSVRLALRAQSAGRRRAMRSSRCRCLDPACGRWPPCPSRSALRQSAAGCPGVSQTCRPDKDFLTLKCPRSGGDRDGQGLEVAALDPRRAGEAESADLVLRIDAHRFLPGGRLVRRRTTLSRASGPRLAARTRALVDYGGPEATQTVSGIGCRWRPPANGRGCCGHGCPALWRQLFLYRQTLGIGNRSEVGMNREA